MRHLSRCDRVSVLASSRHALRPNTCELKELRVSRPDVSKNEFLFPAFRGFQSNHPHPRRKVQALSICSLLEGMLLFFIYSYSDEVFFRPCGLREFL